MCLGSHSPGLEPPFPRLVVVPNRYPICKCGKPLQDPDDVRNGVCGICLVLDRFMPLHPCAGDLSPQKGSF